MTESKIFINGERPYVFRDREVDLLPWSAWCPCGNRNLPPMHDSWRQAYDSLDYHVRRWHL